jgi:hypothetical protein
MKEHASTALTKLLKEAPAPVAELLKAIPPLELIRELLRVVPMSEASRLTSLSEDTIERDHYDKVVYLSSRRKGMTLGNVLTLRRDD